MDLPDELQVIHQPTRLRIMGLLWKHRDVSYTRTRDLLGLSDGNLATHTNKLAEAGFLESRRVLAGDRFEVRFRITTEGRDGFRRYLEVLQGFLEEASGDA